MNIKQIEEADFRCSELTIFEKFSKKNREVVERLKREDVLVFISRSGNQFLFVHGFTKFAGNDSAVDERKQALCSVRHRIIGGTWNPLRIRNYLAEAGIQVTGIPRFEDHYHRLTSNR